MKRRLFNLATLPLLIAGCAASISDQMTRAFTEPMKESAALVTATQQYRSDKGRWPASPDALKQSGLLSDPSILDKYPNLQFAEMADGRLQVTSDGWVERDGPSTTAWSGNIRITLEPTTRPCTSRSCGECSGLRRAQSSPGTPKRR